MRPAPAHAPGEITEKGPSTKRTAPADNWQPHRQRPSLKPRGRAGQIRLGATPTMHQLFAGGWAQGGTCLGHASRPFLPRPPARLHQPKGVAGKCNARCLSLHLAGLATKSGSAPEVPSGEHTQPIDGLHRSRRRTSANDGVLYEPFGHNAASTQGTSSAPQRQQQPPKTDAPDALQL